METQNLLKQSDTNNLLFLIIKTCYFFCLFYYNELNVVLSFTSRPLLCTGYSELYIWHLTQSPKTCIHVGMRRVDMMSLFLCVSPDTWRETELLTRRPQLIHQFTHQGMRYTSDGFSLSSLQLKVTITENCNNWRNPNKPNFDMRQLLILLLLWLDKGAHQ